MSYARFATHLRMSSASVLETLEGEPGGGLGKQYHFSDNSMKEVILKTVISKCDRRCGVVRDFVTRDLPTTRNLVTRECLPTNSIATPRINSCDVNCDASNLTGRTGASTSANINEYSCKPRGVSRWESAPPCKRSRSDAAFAKPLKTFQRLY